MEIFAPNVPIGPHAVKQSLQRLNCSTCDCVPNVNNCGIASFNQSVHHINWQDYINSMVKFLVHIGVKSFGC
jgi:hypothetical protein